jgi:D-alanyl-D-alanine carboxypeptidase/D-alanyl-D-alanine-endopeptidase (penicillin-binding protein 4)
MRMTDRKRVLRGGALLALALCAAAAPASLAEAELDQRILALRAELEGAVESLGGRTARFGVLAISLETGDTLFDHGGHELLAPASNMKLLTTAAALHHLGADFRYRTFLLANGPVEGGRLRGDLVLYGTGDPGLNDQVPGGQTAPFEALADSLAAAGVQVIEGDVVGDGTFFGGPLLGDGWDPDDLNDWFAAPTSGLSFNENVVTLRLVPVGAGLSPEVLTIPEGADIPVTLSIGGDGGRVRIRREDPTAPIAIEGSLARGAREVWRQMTVSDPPRYAASVFYHVLESRGISVVGGVRTVTDAGESQVTARTLWAPAVRPREAQPRVIASYQSPPLLDYLKIVNKKSHNLFAELTLKTLGRVVEGDGSYAGGSRVITRFLADDVGADTAGLRVLDGSGLSGLNRVRAATFVDVLGHMARTPLWDAYWETLPEAGNPRELRRMYQTPAAGNLRAKTGTIARVSALSGVVRSANGERILFSILANDVPSTYGAKRIEDRIGARLASFERPFEPGPPEIRAAQPEAEPAEPAEPTAEPAEPPVVVAEAPRPAPATPAPATPTPEPTPPAARPAPTTTRTHTVVSGENLSVIAARYGVRLNALVEANPGLSPRRLMPGVTLKIPAPPSDDPTPPAERTDVQTHEIKSGESFWTIARTYGVSMNDLMAANPEINPRRIQPGQTVRIPAAPER